MQCFMIVFLYLLFVLGSEGITTHSVTGCSDRVLLNCSNTELIHVERITYYNGTDCNQAVSDLQVCGQPLTGSDTGLVTSCNGKVSCNEILYYGYCPGSKAAKVDYRCIQVNNVKDMCDGFILENTNRIFLSTSNYPSTPTFTDISPCKCFIRGSSITSIQILELILRSTSDGTKSSLEINYADNTYKTESISGTRTRMVYNKRLSTTASTTAEITLNHNNINRQYLWIEIQAVSIHVSCNNDNDEKDFTTSSSSPRLTPPTSTPATSSSPIWTIQPSPSSSTTPASATSSQSVPEEPNIEPPSSTDSSPSSSSTTTHPPQTADITYHSQDTVIILAVLWPLSIILIICITAIVIIFVFLRSKKLVWVKKPPQVERERSPYSGIDLNQRVSVNDGTYQELNTRNSTPQYNNVSQNTHNDYYNLN